MELTNYREQLDRIDNQILSLFSERMAISGEIAQWKQENSMPVLDVKREKEKLRTMEERSPADLGEYSVSLFSLIMELSRSYQNRILHPTSPETEAIAKALKETPQLFPETAFVACQGVEGAYSGIACEKLFKRPNIFYFSSFDAVFSAIEKGLCRYGVIPKPGTKLEDIREIYSHAQAIAQCSAFLQSLPNVKVIPCENTAMAAKMVAESSDPGIAALSSRSCCKLYGLENLKADVQDSGNNHTRFICISKELEIYPGADRTSLMMVLPHEPGSLYKLLSRFNSLGINLTKLESRPMPERSFEFMFYFDLDTSVYSPRFIQLMGELGDISEEHEYLGSYSEVI